jgi:hypothetical protein
VITTTMATVPTKQHLIGLRLLKQKYELMPLVGILGSACIGAVAYVGYMLVSKPDLLVTKTDRHTPRFEAVDPTKPRKLWAPHTEQYQPITELEELRKEIGSYKT